MTDDNKTYSSDEREQQHPVWEAINWNNAEKVDPISYQVWQKLVQNFWLPEKIALSNDIQSWGTLTSQEKDLILKVFSGLTMLDTIQGRFGAYSLMKDARSLYEESTLGNILFMEFVHSKSYSSIFSTLSNTRDINEAFRWSGENEYLRKKADIIMSYYHDTQHLPYPHLRRKIASVFLESFLFYSGFWLPFHFGSQAKLVNTQDIIKLIIRDEAIHGFFISAKFQEELALIPASDKAEIEEFTFDLLDELYANEVKYTRSLYDDLGWSEEVLKFVRYNGNKALQNLGYDPLFPHEEQDPRIINAISLTSSTHDFFSQSGSTYTVGVVEELQEEDWDF